MTVAQMHTEFKIGLDKVDSLAAPNFLVTEIDIFLNNAQEQFIEQRAGKTNIKREGLEETQKRIDDLKNIIENYETTTFVNTTSNKPNGVFVDLPSNYRRAIEEEVSISYTDCNGDATTGRPNVTPTTHDRYNTVVKKDPFNKPNKSQVYRLAFSRQAGNETFELITSPSETITNYYLRYLKDPVSITYGTQYVPPVADVDCELSNHTHREIIALAVKNALEDIQSPRYQTSKIELNEIE